MSNTRNARERLDALLTGLEEEVLRGEDVGSGDVHARRSLIESLIETQQGATGGEKWRTAVPLSDPYDGSGASGGESAARQASVFWKGASDAELRRFPIREMRKRGWFQSVQGMDDLTSLRAYFEQASGALFEWAFHRRQVRGSRSSDEHALLAWQFRILEQAQKRMGRGHIPEFEPNEGWLPELVALTRRNDGVKEVRRFLEGKGVLLVIERHLPGTYLDGAAMLGKAGRPVIGMTLRYDRLDNFWFVLFHELGHVFLHLNRGMDFFDDGEASSRDSIEREADRFALTNLISDQEWGRCLSRFSATEQAVRMDAERVGVHASIIAGRIRRELGDYKILGRLLGQDMVRRQLGEAADDLG